LEAHQVEPLPASLVVTWSVKGPMRAPALAARPNPAHLALVKLEARLEAKGGELTLVTQNVDRLHQRAGSTRVLEMHGSVMRSRCSGPTCSLSPFVDNQVPGPVAETLIGPVEEILPEAVAMSDAHRGSQMTEVPSAGDNRR
jgi:hypothetical protein